ncbi:MmcQ/YjbR family DNA-binding protein [Crocinitomicaceae bacterium]|nr:MmcQ/YjbR family DNA-binding protein [Crocinitomicaceae bacterium]
MNIEEYRDYCTAKKAVTESFPFDKNTLVFKVANKMFALTGVDTFNYINLKCDPERAVELRETYNGVRPGYHMNKKLWNSVYLEEDVPDALVYELIDHSYDLIVASLTKKVRSEYALG